MKDLDQLIKDGMFNTCGIYTGDMAITHPTIYIKNRILRLLDIKS